MNPGGNRILVRLKEHYDKVMALAVLLALIGSFVLLGIKIGSMRKIDADFESWLRGQRAVNPHAAAVDPAGYQAAREALSSPVLLAVPGTSTNGALPWMFVPETRFNCRECRHPIPIKAEECPFCKTPVTAAVAEPQDQDNDGMLSEWERTYALDPFDPSDAQKDVDGDGFTNIEEFTAQPKTDPTDPNIRPPVVDRLRLQRISGSQFALRFNSSVTTGSGDKFGLNYKLPDGQTKTDFVKIGESVAGFKVAQYEKKIERAAPPALGTVDRSELTLLTPKGDPIKLIKGQPVQYVELTAHLTLDFRGVVQPYAVRKGDDFDLDGRSYSVIDVDAKAQHVIVTDKQTRINRTVKLASAASGE